ncbi:MAG: acetyl/propionyl/methylcrotonyl-CoA carboxylase subunit alpha [Rhodospirillales bacterium]|nr:acetyl/propionyl/methylcrotonyl-CoA carboxylase subunit alpha [Rhodospirillales bacterium]
MIRTLLIANRGEIACRIARTARRMGIRVVAVYSDADRDALHVAMADAAVHIGAAPPRESYLRADRILDAARATGADAVHPGYGFLSENAAFAEACAEAGIAFVGPPAGAIRAMGDKARSKALMEKARVPLVPGYHGEDQSERFLADAAGDIGYPVLIKASAGGGGKGMKIVEHASDFSAQLASAKREAASSFGDDRVLVEKYLTRPRHIEIQVFADSHGNCIHLNERDCSIQRRHQKVLEEAPAPGMTPERRAAMGQAAVAAAKAVGYVGAGTVEFIADESGTFYFMEMNTRLQVEHPVTEMITGLDLVEWQLRVAEGERLSLAQAEVPVLGHAIEARLYAEDPDKDFLPSVGLLQHLHLPATDGAVRVDTGVRSGDAISMHYDPMIAKLIVHGKDRAAALQQLRAALAQCQALGPATNIAFLARVAAHPAYAAGEVDTGFIARHRAALLPPPVAATDRDLALAALFLLLQRRSEAARTAAQSADPWSPWHAADGWRLNGDSYHALTFADPASDGARATVIAHFRGSGFALECPGGTIAAEGTLAADGALAATLDGMRATVTALRQRQSVFVIDGAFARRLDIVDPMAGAEDRDADSGRLQAPMPGKVTVVHVRPGDKVKRGQVLMAMEAMKMEHAVAAPRDGTIKELRYKAGEQVGEGEALIVFEDEDA